MSVTNEEITFLILRYFQESGFEHSLFTYMNEVQVDSSQIKGFQVPQGALITLLEKGLLYTQLERKMSTAKNIYDLTHSTPMSLLKAVLIQEPNQGGEKSDNNEEIKVTSYPLGNHNSITLQEHSSSVSVSTWTKEGYLFATGSRDNTAIIWNLHDLDNIKHHVINHGDKDSKEGELEVSSLAWSPDGSLLVTGCVDGFVRGFKRNENDNMDLELKQVYSKDNRKKVGVNLLKFDITGKKLLVLYQFFKDDKEKFSKIRILNSDTGEKLRSFKCDSQILDVAWISAVSFVIACENGSTGVFESIHAEPHWYSRIHDSSINCIAVEPNGTAIASCSDRNVKILKSGNDVLTIPGSFNRISMIKWLNNGLIIFVGYETMYIYDYAAGKPLHELKGHQKIINAIAVSPDEEVLVTGSADQTVRFWNIQKGQLILSLLIKNSIYDIQYCPEGKYVTVCDKAGHVIVIKTAQVLTNSD